MTSIDRGMDWINLPEHDSLWAFVNAVTNIQVLYNQEILSEQYQLFREDFTSTELFYFNDMNTIPCSNKINIL
jgi:hypothetical protein